MRSFQLNYQKGIWAVVLTHFILNIANCTSRHIEKAFFRTLVSCDHPSVGLLAGGHRRHHHWTGSAHCGDKSGVLRSGLFVEGQMWSLAVMMHVPLLPFVAAAADRWGRRPILLAGVAGFIAFLLLLAASQAWDAVPMPDSGLARMGLVSYPWFALGAYVFRGITFNFGVVWASMLFDLTNDNTSRAFAFALLEGSNQIGELVGSLIAGHIGHLQLLDYSGVYVVFAAIVAVAFLHILFNVPETLNIQGDAESRSLVANQALTGSSGSGPSHHRDNKGSILARVSAKSLATDISDILSNRKLIPLFAGEFLGGISGGVDLLVASMTISAFGWGQGDLEYYQAPTPLLVLVSTIVVVPIVTSYFGDQALPEWFLCSLCAANVCILALSALTALHPAFLLAPRYLMSIMAFQVPLMSARLANLVQGDGQAKLFALRSAANSMAYAVALQFFTTGLFFDPAATGAIATIPFVASALIGCVGLILVLFVVAPNTCAQFLWRHADAASTKSTKPQLGGRQPSYTWNGVESDA